MFLDMVRRIKEDSVEKLCVVQIQQQEELPATRLNAENNDYVMSHGDSRTNGKSVRKDKHKVGRNDPCPCGSGKKYKKCCGA